MPVIHAGHCLLGQCFILGNASYSSWSLLTWAVLYCMLCSLFKLVIAYLGSGVGLSVGWPTGVQLVFF